MKHDNDYDGNVLTCDRNITVGIIVFKLEI